MDLLQKNRKKILTNNSGGDHHSNVVAEALCVKLRVPDDFGHLRRLPVIIKFNIYYGFCIINVEYWLMIFV